MQIIIDQVDGHYYADIILSPNDIQKIHLGEMVNGHSRHKKKEYFIGIRLQGIYEYEQEEDTEAEEN